MPTRLTGTPSFASLGVQAPQPPNIVAIGRAPTVNDFATFNTGDLWINISSLSNSPPVAPTANDIWMLVSKNKRIANATWVPLAGAGDLQTLTGNTTLGGPPLPVPPDAAHNINTVGDNIGITVDGDPATNTLTWSLVGGGGGVATQSFHTDDNNVEVPIGTAVIPAVGAVGQINVLGGNTLPNAFININTRQGADIHTVDVDLNNSIIQPFTSATGNEGVYSLGVTGIVADRFLHGFGQTNTFVGRQSGNFTMNTANASTNTCVGSETGRSLVGTAALQGTLNTFVGNSAGSSTTDGSASVFIGSGCGQLATIADDNAAVGTGSLGNLLTGGANCTLGFDTGLNYVTNESGNVVLGFDNRGRVGENNTIRIGGNGAVVATTDNIFIGRDSATSAYNVAVATNNVFIGANNATALTTGSANVAISGGALAGITSGTRNVAISAGSGNALLTGSYNVMAGYISGSTFTGAESSNICINSPGVIADSNTLRIGTSSGAGNQQLNRAFIHGIYGVNPPGGGVLTVVQDMNGQLGTAAAPVNPVTTNSFFAENDVYMDGYFPANPGAFTTIQYPLVRFNNGGNYNNATYTYTAPADGYYFFITAVGFSGLTANAQIIPNTIDQLTMAFVVTSGIARSLASPSMNPFYAQATTTATGLNYQSSYFAFLQAGDTVNVQAIAGGTGVGDALSLIGPDPAVRTYFAGYQIG